MVNKGGPTKQVGGQKRKYSSQSTAHETKSMENKTERAMKAPLKAEIILKLSALEKEHEALKIENEKLKTKIIELEEQAKQSNLREDPVD